MEKSEKITIKKQSFFDATKFGNFFDFFEILHKYSPGAPILEKHNFFMAPHCVRLWSPRLKWSLPMLSEKKFKKMFSSPIWSPDYEKNIFTARKETVTELRLFKIL